MRTRRRSRGVALIMVLTLIALVTGVVTEFMLSSALDVNLAFGARDELQAELNALSVLRMRALVLKQQAKLRAVVAGLSQQLGGLQQGATATDAAASAGGGGTPLGPILEQIPVTCGLLNAIARTAGSQQGDKGWAGDFFPGECEAFSHSEHGKISINLLATTTNQQAVQVQKLLAQVLSNPALRPLFEGNDRSGEHAESPTALVAHINDWIDSNHNELGGFGDEDRYYQYRRDSYRAKNAPMDSVAELRLVHGVNDLVYELLAKNITVHNASTKLELGTASEQVVIFGLIGAMMPGAALEPALAAVQPVVALLRQARAMGASPTVGMLQGALTSAGASALFDPKVLKATFGESDETTWYTIEASGNVGRSTRRMKVVFQASEGIFYYARID